MERDYQRNDIVYYKRDGKEKWLGPAKVIFQDGKVIFIREGSSVYRVSANRVVKAGEELSKLPEKTVGTEERVMTDKNHTSFESTSEVNSHESTCEDDCDRELEIPMPSTDSSQTVSMSMIDNRQTEIDRRQTQTPLPMTDNGRNKKRLAEDEINCDDRPIKKSLRVCLKKNDTVEFLNETGQSVKCVVLGPAGKRTGENKNWYNKVTSYPLDLT